MLIPVLNHCPLSFTGIRRATYEVQKFAYGDNRRYALEYRTNKYILDIGKYIKYFKGLAKPALEGLG